MELTTSTPSEVAGTVKRVATEAGEKLRSQTQEAYETAKSEAERFASERRNGLAAYTRDISDAVETACSTLDQRGRSGIAGLARKAARQLDSLGDRVQGQNVGGLLETVEDFARRRPAIFLGGTFLLSFALIRFLGRDSDADEAPSADRDTAASI